MLQKRLINIEGYYEKFRDERDVDCWISPNCTCAAHFHSSLELIYVVSGKVLVMSGGQSFDVCASEAIITTSYSLHSYKCFGANKAIMLTVPMNFIPTFKNLIKHKRIKDNLVKDSPEHEMRTALLKLAALHLSNNENIVLIKGYTYTILGLLLEKLHTEPYPDKKSSTFSRDVLVHLQDVFASPELTLSSASAHFGYSKSRFSHIFTENFGYSFWEYITLLRCKNAALLMEEEGESLINAAMNSGFENLRTFYRAFKSVYGTTPTLYLKSRHTSI